MRRAVPALLVVLLGACPSLRNPDSNGGADAGSGSGSDAGVACPPIPTCSATIHYSGTGTSVSLAGDFSPTAWTTPIAMTPNPSGGFDATIPVDDEQVVLYKFVVDGAWLADPDNTRQSPDGYGGFNSVMRADCDHCPHRQAMDWRDGIMYFIMLDRFDDADPTNDMPVPGAEQPGQYQGGDIAGVTAKIDAGYFDDLGINTIWITSPLNNTWLAEPGSDGHMYSGYHGYWPKDETVVDTHFGSEDDLKTMVAHAHAHGIQILIDYVMNHVTTDAPIYLQNPGWFWPDSNGSGGNCVCGQGCPVFNTVCWFDTFLPTFNMLDSDARRWSVNNAITWAKDLGIDGFRLDAVKQVETVWFTDTRARAQAELAWDQPFYMVGETFDGNRDLIKSYIDPQTMLDGQFDFPLRAQVLYTLLHRTGTMSDLSGFVATNDGYYGPGAVMSTFLGNHDVPRAIEHALDNPMYDPWDGGKENNWSNQPTLPDTANPFQRLQMAYTFLFTSPGIPMIYYGDEYGQPGAGDPDNRRFMPWSGYTQNQTWLHDQIAALAKLRAQHPATRRGTRMQLGVTTDTFVYSMSMSGDTVYVALNRSDTAQPATGLPPGNYTDLIANQPVTLPLTIPPRTGMVLAAQ
ncbi:MAG TPA: alpha-amylase family glycosyl hydrolase [Kofleriaceae bacterium]|nr:alpha-amylase family glycosyl hydrolase [Kofleriaceae bacterium]